MTKTYQITNTISGQVIGLYTARSPEEALDMFARDAGYVDYAAACLVAPVQELELKVEAV